MSGPPPLLPLVDSVSCSAVKVSSRFMSVLAKLRLALRPAAPVARPEEPSRAVPGVDFVFSIAMFPVGIDFLAAAGEVLRELGADLALSFSFFFAIFALATERCSCEIGYSRIGCGSRETSTGPDGVLMDA